MWDETKQKRLNKLRRREKEGVLTHEEHDELERLLHELEQEEWDALRPALGHLHEEQMQLQEELGRFRLQNTLLSALAERQDYLLKRAQAQLASIGHLTARASRGHRAAS